jgi:hypothetical protein
MQEDLSQVVYAVERVRSELSSITTSLSWISIAAVVAIFVVGCDPARDEKALVDACLAEAMARKIDASGMDAGFGSLCMSAKGYEFAWHQSACTTPMLTFFSEGCYEKRGPWRTTKRWAVFAWGWLFPKWAIAS